MNSKIAIETTEGNKQKAEALTGGVSTGETVAPAMLSAKRIASG